MILLIDYHKKLDFNSSGLFLQGYLKLSKLCVLVFAGSERKISLRFKYVVIILCFFY